MGRQRSLYAQWQVWKVWQYVQLYKKSVNEEGPDKLFSQLLKKTCFSVDLNINQKASQETELEKMEIFIFKH